MTKAETAAGGGTTKVLIVDDQRIIAEAVRRMLLEDPSLELTWCGEGATALETARETGIDLPGLETAARLYEAVVTRGWQDEGTQALARLYPGW